jgi:potassium/hydrogen antiporter
MEASNYFILVGSSLLIVSILTSFAAVRFGTPLLLIFLGVGLLAGEDGIGGLVYNDAHGAFLIGSAALAVILFESGLDTRWSTYRLAAAPAMALSTAGVAITTAIIGAVAHWALGLSWVVAMLLGAVLSSTDAAALFFLLRVGGITIRERVRSTLEIESGTNDPMAILLTLILVEAAQGMGGTFVETAVLFVRELGLGAVTGIAGGLLLARLVNSARIDPGLNPVISLASALFIFAGTNMMHGSGFLAVYIAGVIAGNVHIRGAQGLKRFHSGLAWLGQIVMFVILGLLATPSQFVGVAWPGLLIAAVLILIARPLAVAFCLLPFRFTGNEAAFVGWVGLRGAVSLLLALVPMMAGLPEGRTIFNLAFVIVIVSLLVQGWTIRPMARWLRLIVPRRTGPVDRVELELPGGVARDLVAYKVHPQSAVARGQRPPGWARPSLVIREGQVVPIHRARPLQAADQVYIFADRARITLLDRLYGGALPIDQDDRDFFGDLVLAPDATVESVALMYDLPTDRAKPGLTLADLFRLEYGDAATAGDRLRFGPVELIARDVGEDGTVSAVGMALEPTETGLARLSLRAAPGQAARAIRCWLATLPIPGRPKGS